MSSGLAQMIVATIQLTFIEFEKHVEKSNAWMTISTSDWTIANWNFQYLMSIEFIIEQFPLMRKISIGMFCSMASKSNLWKQATANENQNR